MQAGRAYETRRVACDAPLDDAIVTGSLAHWQIKVIGNADPGHRVRARR